MSGFLYITSGDTRLPDEHARLTHEIHRLQKQLARLSDVGPAKAAVNGRQSNATASRAERILKLRAVRNDIFGRSLFGEPAWDMLLHLYDAHLQGRREYVAGLCAASGVPPSTALRWIHCLLDRGWIEREEDACDHRRFIVALTAKGTRAMERFFEHPEFASL